MSTTELLPNQDIISTPSDLRSLYVGDKSVKVGAFFEQNADIFSLDKLKETDKKAYVEVLKSFSDLIANGMIAKESMPNLVEEIAFYEKSAPGSGSYDSQGIARWHNYSISLYKNLLETDEKGQPKHEVRHVVYHELSHSILDLADQEKIELPEDLEEILEQMDPTFESEHIAHCIETGQSSEIINIERKADLIGMFLNSERDMGRFLEIRRSMVAEGKEAGLKSDPEKLAGFDQDSRRIFNCLNKDWDRINREIALASELDLSDLSSPLTEEVAPAERANMGEYLGVDNRGISEKGSAQASKDSGPGKSRGAAATSASRPSYNESDKLGRANHNPGWIATIGGVIAGMGEEIKV